MSVRAATGRIAMGIIVGAVVLFVAIYFGLPAYQAHFEHQRDWAALNAQLKRIDSQIDAVANADLVIHTKGGHPQIMLQDTHAKTKAWVSESDISVTLRSSASPPKVAVVYSAVAADARAAFEDHWRQLLLSAGATSVDFMPDGYDSEFETR